MKADALFAKMRNQKNHFAVVLDEYGGMCGVITITDLVEQLEGDFDVDEAAPDPPKLERLDSRTWKIPGICPLHEVDRALGFQFDSDQYETFSGLLIGTLGEIPKDGTQQKMQLGPYTVQILEVKQHRIEKAVVRLKNMQKHRKRNVCKKCLQIIIPIQHAVSMLWEKIENMWNVPLQVAYRYWDFPTIVRG